jgi:hypothetical protein
MEDSEKADAEMGSSVNNDGKDYEHLTQAIFESLLNQKDARNIEVQHNIVRKGKTVEHQIDVYWEFSPAEGVTYETVVECRDWESRISQEKVMAFREKLDDLNASLGIIVSRSGYQSGALEYAGKHGILLYELFDEPVPEPTRIAAGSSISFEFNPKDWTLRCIYFETKIDNIKINLDLEWLRIQENLLGVSLNTKDRMHLGPQIPSQFKIYDEQQVEQSNVLKLFRPIAEQLSSSRESGELRHTHKFDTSSFVRVNWPDIQFVKVTSIAADVAVIKHPPQIKSMKVKGFSAFVLKNLHSKTAERHLVSNVYLKK